MKGKMIDTTNNRFDYLVGRVGDVTINLQVWFQVVGLTVFRTSDINHINYRYEEDAFFIDVFTLNSKYVFQLGVDE